MQSVTVYLCELLCGLWQATYASVWSYTS